MVVFYLHSEIGTHTAHNRVCKGCPVGTIYVELGEETQAQGREVRGRREGQAERRHMSRALPLTIEGVRDGHVIL